MSQEKNRLLFVGLPAPVNGTVGNRLWDLPTEEDGVVTPGEWRVVDAYKDPLQGIYLNGDIKTLQGMGADIYVAEGLCENWPGYFERARLIRLATKEDLESADGFNSILIELPVPVGPRYVTLRGSDISTFRIE